MLERLRTILSGKRPGEVTTADFNRMLELARRMLRDANEVYWGKDLSPETRTELYTQDVELNKLERQVRVDVVSQLAGPVPGDVPYGLLIMSLVKDVERLGDYAKNLTEIERMSGVAAIDLPEDSVRGELLEVRRLVERLVDEAPQIYRQSDRERAHALTVEGRSMTRRCDSIVEKVARGEYSASVAVHFTLASRFYKRILSHLLNLLSSVIMPLHKLDYYDETAIYRG